MHFLLSLCVLCVLCVSLVDALKTLHHRDAENTETTQRKINRSPVYLAQNDIQRTNYRNHVGDQMPQAKLLQRLKID